MNRSDYLEGLTKSLSFLSEENRAAAVAFYAEMLDDRIEEGIDETEAVEKMESIEAITARFEAEYGEKPDKATVVIGGAKVETQPAEGTQAEDDLNEQAERLAEAKARMEEIKIRFAEKESARAAREAEREAREVEREARRAEREARETAWETVEESFSDAASEAAQAKEAEIEARRAAWEAKAEAFEARHATADIESSVENTVREAVEMAKNAAREAIDTAQEAIREAKAATQAAANGASDKPAEPVIKTIKAPSESVKTITVHVSNVGVKVERCDAGEASISYYTDEFTRYETTFENGNLMLNRLRESILDGNQMFRMFKFGFFSYRSSNPPIIVKVPQDSLIDLDITTTNCPISLDSLRGLGGVHFKSTNGNLTCETASMLALNMRSSNGKISLRGVQVKREIDAKTTNSRIEAETVFGGENVTLGTTNSTLAASVIKAGGALSLTTSNASLRVEKLLANSYRLRTTNGSISGTMPGNASLYRISSGTSNGKNSLPPHQMGDIPLEVFTSNASIKLTFENA